MLTTPMESTLGSNSDIFPGNEGGVPVSLAVESAMFVRKFARPAPITIGSKARMAASCARHDS
jgi:hypothetical protein